MLEGEGKPKGRAGFGCRMRVWRKCGCRIGRDGMGWKNGRIGCSLRKKTTPKESNWGGISYPIHVPSIRHVWNNVQCAPQSSLHHTLGTEYSTPYSGQRPAVRRHTEYLRYTHIHTHTHTPTR